MKICFIANGGKPAVFTKMWIDHFSKNHDVSLITYRKPDIVYDQLCTVYHLAVSGFVKLAMKTKKTIKEINPDIVIAIYLVGCGFYGSLSNFHPFMAIPLGSDIATFPDRSRYSKFKIHHVLKKADLVQVQDPLSSKRVRKLGCSEDKILLNKWGIDIQKFKPQQIKKEYDIINIHGSSFKKQDVKTLLRSIVLIKEEIPDIKCLLLGNRDPANKLAYELGILDNIKFGGFVDRDQIPNYYNKSRIFVDCFYPDHNHGGHTYGMGLLEAMSCGLLTVVANRQTLHTADRWYHGKTFPGGYADQLAKRVIALLNNEPENNLISRLNRTIIEEKFDWNQNIRKIESTLQEYVKK